MVKVQYCKNTELFVLGTKQRAGLNLAPFIKFFSDYSEGGQWGDKPEDTNPEYKTQTIKPQNHLTMSRDLSDSSLRVFNLTHHRKTETLLR